MSWLSPRFAPPPAAPGRSPLRLDELDARVVPAVTATFAPAAGC